MRHGYSLTHLKGPTYLRNVRQNDSLERPEIRPKYRNILRVLDAFGQRLLVGERRQLRLQRVDVGLGVHRRRVGVRKLREFSGRVGVGPELGDAAVERLVQGSRNVSLKNTNRIL